MTEREAWAEYIAGPEWTGKHADIWRKAVEFEREACAKVCEEKAAGWEDRLGNDISDEYVRIGKIAAAQIAASIRMRSNNINKERE